MNIQQVELLFLSFFPRQVQFERKERVMLRTAHQTSVVTIRGKTNIMSWTYICAQTLAKLRDGRDTILG